MITIVDLISILPCDIVILFVCVVGAPGIYSLSKFLYSILYF